MSLIIDIPMPESCSECPMEAPSSLCFGNMMPTSRDNDRYSSRMKECPIKGETGSEMEQYVICKNRSFEKILENFCDNFCRFPLEYGSGDDNSEKLKEKCMECPLSQL